MNHSQLPWKVFHGELPKETYITDANGKIVTGNTVFYREDVSKEDADYIVSSCNEFENEQHMNASLYNENQQLKKDKAELIKALEGAIQSVMDVGVLKSAIPYEQIGRWQGFIKEIQKSPKHEEWTAEEILKREA